MLKPTKQEIKMMKEFANRSATSTFDAIGKKCMRNALENNDFEDFNLQDFIRHIRDNISGR